MLSNIAKLFFFINLLHIFSNFFFIVSTQWPFMMLLCLWIVNKRILTAFIVCINCTLFSCYAAQWVRMLIVNSYNLLMKNFDFSFIIKMHDCISMQKMFSCNFIFFIVPSINNNKKSREKAGGKLFFYFEKFSIKTIRSSLNAIKFNL